MKKIVIEGGYLLKGQVAISGAKNAALPLLAASILTEKECILRNTPILRDIDTFITLLQGLGVKLENRGKDIIVTTASNLVSAEVPYDLVKTMRASCLILGPLLARCGYAKVSLPGGCAIGARPIDLHLAALKKLGAQIELENGYIIAKADRLKGSRIYLDIPTVTGTENIMMAAALAEGKTNIENAAKEPEITNLAEAINLMGGKIEGAGTDVIEITGVDSMHGFDIPVIPDRIEAGTFIIAAVITGGEVKVNRCIPEHLEALLLKLKEVGVRFDIGKDYVFIKQTERIKSVDIKTSYYPSFPTDMQAQMMALMTISEGTSMIIETVFENRFMHVPELKRMGADIAIEGHTAMIKGVKTLTGAPVMATDLRASASLVLAGLAAKGITIIDRIYHIDRGYECIEKKLSSLNARIRRVDCL